MTENLAATSLPIMFRLGPWEIVLIVMVVLIIFGPKRLPELGKGIGHFFKNFKNSLSGGGKEDYTESVKQDKTQEKK